MAKLFPETPEFGSSKAEERVFGALRGLPDPWRVFHGVAWQSVRDGRQGDGEADFVLLHPDVGLLVLEVKGGGISIDRGRWCSIDGAGARHHIKNPYVQAAASKHALIGYLKATLPSLPYLHAGHGVVFPDVAGDVRLGPAALPELTWLRQDLKEVTAALDRLAEHWGLEGNLGSGHVEAITATLAPTLQVRTLLRPYAEFGCALMV